MATILDELKTQTSINNEEYAKELEEAGFPAMAVGYPIITIKAIEEYLLNFATKRWKRAEPRGFYFRQGIQDRDREFGDGYIYEFNGQVPNLHWKETRIEEYPARPPRHV